MEHWPCDVQLEMDSLEDLESRQWISWIMMKSEAHKVYPHSKVPILQSRIFLSTSEYAQIPAIATDLLIPLISKVQSIWDRNFDRFQERLRVMV